MRKRIKPLLMIVVVICLLIAMTACVAEGNLKNAKGWGLDVNSPSDYRRPFAESDPNNPLDQKEGDIDNLKTDENWYLKDFFIILSNSESINNLFYDYTPEDFGINVNTYTLIEEYGGGAFSVPYMGSDLVNGSIEVDGVPCTMVEILREHFVNGKKIDLSTFRRAVRINFAQMATAINNCKEPKYLPTATDWYNMIENILQLDFVVGVRGLSTIFFTSTPSGYNTNRSWGLETINAREAWDYTTGSASVTVGIADSGIRLTHDAIEHAHCAGNLNCGSLYNVDEVGHGTCIAGVMFAKDATNGIYGVCHDAMFVSLKVNDGTNIQADPDSALEDVDLFIDCLEHAQANNIPIVNFSGGFYTQRVPNCGYIPQNKIAELYNAVASYDGLLVVAAGNQTLDLDTSSNRLYPQCFELDNIIVVGASTSINSKYGNSNIGKQVVDIFAPGESIYVINPASESGILPMGQSGTSLAAPFVAGVAALLKSYDPTLTATQIKEAILNSVTPVTGLGNYCATGGILNARAALEYVCNHENSTYTNRGIDVGHHVECDRCDYSINEAHTWSPVKSGGTILGFTCLPCDAYRAFIEIIHPNSLGDIKNELDRLAGNMSLGRMTSIEINEHTSLVYIDGRYGLLIDCDENGRPLADIPDNIFIAGYDTTELQLQLQTRSAELMAMQAPSVLTKDSYITSNRKEE